MRRHAIDLFEKFAPWRLLLVFVALRHALESCGFVCLDSACEPGAIGDEGHRGLLPDAMDARRGVAVRGCS